VQPREFQDYCVSCVLQIVVTDMNSIELSLTQQLRNTMRQIGIEKELHRPATSGNSRS
jgi:hypothetical protein